MFNSSELDNEAEKVKLVSMYLSFPDDDSCMRMEFIVFCVGGLFYLNLSSWACIDVLVLQSAGR